MVQIYVPENTTETIKDFIECLGDRLETPFEWRAEVSDIIPHQPVIVVCQHLARLQNDIYTGTKYLSGIPCDYQAIIVLHVSEEHALPQRLTSDNLKGEAQKYIFFAEFAFSNDTIIKCEMNKRGLHKLRRFLKKNIITEFRPEIESTSKPCYDYTICFVLLIMFGLTLSVGIAELAIGCAYFNACSTQKMVPICLILSGCILIVIAAIWLLLLEMKTCKKEIPTGCCIFSAVSGFVSLIWSILCGGLWVITTYVSVNKDTYVTETEGTCYNTLLKSSFIVFAHAFLSLIGIAINIIYACKKNTEDFFWS